MLAECQWHKNAASTCGARLQMLQCSLRSVNRDVECEREEESVPIRLMLAIGEDQELRSSHLSSTSRRVSFCL